MTDILTLGIEVDSREVRTATKDLDGFQESGEAAGRTTDDLAESASAMGAKVALAATAAAVAMGAMVKSAIDTADAMRQLSVRTGIGTETLSGWAHAAQMSDTNVQSLGVGLKTLAKNMQDGAKEFDAYGIATRDANGNLLATDQVFAKISDKFATMADGPEKAALSMALLGKSGEELIPLLNGGSDALELFKLEAIRLGIAIDDDFSRNAERFNDNLDLIQSNAVGAANALAKELLPVLNEITQAFINGEGRALSFGSAIGGGLATGLEAFAVIGLEVAYVFNSIGREIGAVAAQVAFFLQDVSGVGADALKDPFERAALVRDDLIKDNIEAAKKQQELIDKILGARSGPAGIGTDTAETMSGTRLSSSSGATGKAPKAAGGGQKKALAGFDVMIDTRFEAEELAKLRDAEATAELDAISAQFRAIQEEQDAFASWQDELKAQRAQAELEANRAGFEAQFLAQTDQFLKVSEQNQLFYDQGLIEREEFERRKLEITEKYLIQQNDQEAIYGKARADFAKKTTQDQVSATLGALSIGLSGLAQHNRSAFEAQKAFAIAEATINGINGAEKTWSSYPYPFNIPMTAAHVIGTVGRIQQIRSTSFGSGGSIAAPTGSAVASGQAIPATQENQTAQQVQAQQGRQADAKQIVNLTLVGDVFDARFVADKIIPSINEAVGNGVELRVTAGA